MLTREIFCSVIALSLFSACSSESDPESSASPPAPAASESEIVTRDIVIDDAFTDGDAHGWQAVMRDIPVDILAEVERRVASGESLGPTGVEVRDARHFDFPEERSHWLINFGIKPLPPEVSAETGFLLQGNNHSDDLDMSLVKKIGPAEGVKPSTRYTIAIEETFASNAQAGGFGVGGAETLQVWMGATTKDPNEKRIALGHVHFAEGIKDGDFFTNETTANGLPFQLGSKPFKLVTVEHSIVRESAPDGTLWLMVGTHSGYESFSALYYTKVRAKLTPLRP